MAYDKVVDSLFLDGGLKTIANAIRGVTGRTDELWFPYGFAEEIGTLSAGQGGGSGVDTRTCTITVTSENDALVSDISGIYYTSIYSDDDVLADVEFGQGEPNMELSVAVDAPIIITFGSEWSVEVESDGFSPMIVTDWFIIGIAYDDGTITLTPA